MDCAEPYAEEKIYLLKSIGWVKRVCHAHDIFSVNSSSAPLYNYVAVTTEFWVEVWGCALCFEL